VARNDPGVLANVALVLAYFGEDLGAMMALVDRALAQNPSFAQAWYRSAVLRLWAGQPDLAIEHAETALRPNPRETMSSPVTLIGETYFLKVSLTKR
jgi:adenylate cyclase